MSKSPPEKYRPNVAIIVLNAQGEILACERSDIDGAWQVPQGGLEKGETTDAAMRRELKEEIGTSNVTVIGKLPETIRYEWPAHLYERGYRGQEQTFYLVRLNPGAVINLEADAEVEFQSYQWVSVETLCNIARGFKQDSYRTAFKNFDRLFPNTLKHDDKEHE